MLDITVATPTLDEAEAMIRFRTKMFVMELVDSGCDYATALRHTVGWTTARGVARYSRRLEEWLANPAIYVRVVRCGRMGGDIVGLFVADIGYYNYVRSIQLHPGIRSAGVGSRLMMEYFQAALQLGASTTVELDVFQGNRVARAFYARLGFEQIGHETQRIGETLVMRGVLMTILRLQRSIR